MTDTDTLEPVCITAKLRADIAERDWSACHIAGDRAEPVKLGERRPVRLWRR